MRSLFSCLFALLLYSGRRGGATRPMPASCGTGGERRARDVIEIMQVRKADSSIAQDVRGVRAEAAVKVRHIQQHAERSEGSRVLSVKGMESLETCHHERV